MIFAEERYPYWTLWPADGSKRCAWCKMHQNMHKIQNRSAGIPSPPYYWLVKPKNRSYRDLKPASILNAEKDTQPVTWRQMVSKPQNNQPSAVICRVSCQQRPRGSACVKQTFAQRPFFFFFFDISLVCYALEPLPLHLVSCCWFWRHLLSLETRAGWK